ncbi:unnamed protein product [Rotaria sordida]|uniref:Uncharacterized protein n=1 Tax=Rotaria sordida TaxID=392033 RepID=A0A819I5Q4_9BILA|nr:unnamed protein product [Rotaria sordida]
MDQTTVRVTKFLGKIPSCALHRRLRESMLSGHGASIINLREQNEQYFCTAMTKLIDKELEFRPLCVRIQTIENLKNSMMNGLCTIEIKTVVVGDKTGALELTLWEPNFHQLQCGESYQIKLVKSRLLNCQIALSAVGDTSFINIEDLENVQTNVESSITVTYTSKGRIIQIGKNQQEYGCQACGNHDVIKQSDSFICNVCQSRILNCNTSADDLLKIIIIMNSREEYSLSISKAIIISLLKSINDLYINITVPNEENWVNSLINLMVEFKFDQHSAIISELKSIAKADLQNEQTKNDEISK